MEAQKLAWFKNWFEAQRETLVQTYSSAQNEFSISKEELADEMDLTSYELEQSMRMRLKAREGLFLKKIDEALSRISNGSFGHCMDCDDEIDVRRLEARPTATHCVSCKEASEHKESIHIDGHMSKSLGKRITLVA